MALSPGLSLDALAHGVAQAPAHAAVPHAQHPRRNRTDLEAELVPCASFAYQTASQSPAASVRGLLLSRRLVPRDATRYVAWACQFRGCQYRRPANSATRRSLPVRDGGTPDGGVHSPLPEAEESAQHDGAAPPAEIPEALQNPAAANAQTPSAAAGAGGEGEGERGKPIANSDALAPSASAAESVAQAGEREASAQRAFESYGNP